ncbi:hypothetical protein [Maribacter arcticus]|uniref:hypothetical protein n=1 Tax=Maribacter arcticus TaxID=561365 RepID=UPI00300227A9
MENKIGKYIKYAIGEIILVVIGILIAVGINGWYNASKNEEKIRNILIQAQQNLLVDIKDASRIFNRFIEIDSLSRNILTDSVSVETELQAIDINVGYVDFNTNKSAFQQLVNNLENMPKKYAALFPEFAEIYEVLQSDIDAGNANLIAVAQDSKFDRIYTDPKFSEYYMGKYSKKEYVAYILSDPFLKNKTIKYAESFARVASGANRFRELGTSLYKKIDSLLGNQITQYPDLLRILPNEEIMHPYLGDYEWVGGTGIAPEVSISIENGQLVTHVQGVGSLPTNWKKGSYFYNRGSIIRFYVNKKGQHFRERTDGIFNQIWMNKRDLDL